MTNFIIFYALLIVLSAFIINGFYAITRGRWEKKPNGDLFWTGKIFKGYHKWLQTHTTKMVAYENEEFLKKFFILKTFFSDKEVLSMDENFAVVQPMLPIRKAMFFAFAESKGLRIDIKEVGLVKNNIIAIYKEVKEYKYPEWFRDPMGECINCLSSTGGTLLFVFFAALTYNVNSIYPTEAASVFISLGIGFKIAFWVIFCITLSYMNELVLNLNAALKKEAGK